MAYTTTPTHGKVSRVEKNDVAVDFTDGWELNTSVKMADISRQGQNWEEILPGMANAKGSFSGHFVAGNTEQKALFDNIVTASPGTKLTDMKLLVNGSTEGFSGDMYLTDFPIQARIGDRVSYKCSFQFTGAVTYSDAQ